MAESGQAWKDEAKREGTGNAYATHGRVLGQVGGDWARTSRYPSRMGGQLSEHLGIGAWLSQCPFGMRFGTAGRNEESPSVAWDWDSASERACPCSDSLSHPFRLVHGNR
jgi:hypothetical protein